MLAVGLVGYLAWSVIGARKEAASATELQVVPDAPAAPRPTGVALAQLLAGLGGLVIGGRLLVDNAVEIAADLGVAESVIGLTVVAAGTSLPELATSTVAALRKQTDIAVGNVVGSNIFNLLGIGGIAAMVNPLDAGAIGSLEIGVMLASSLLLLPLMRSGFKLVRAEGAALLAGFAAYFWLLWP